MNRQGRQSLEKRTVVGQLSTWPAEWQKIWKLKNINTNYFLILFANSHIDFWKENQGLYLIPFRTTDTILTRLLWFTTVIIRWKVQALKKTIFWMRIVYESCLCVWKTVMSCEIPFDVMLFHKYVVLKQRNAFEMYHMNFISTTAAMPNSTQLSCFPWLLI